jgi:ribonuclease HI
LRNGITKWMPGWKRRNWQRKGGELKNLELWQRLDRAIVRHEIEWRWVRGHTGVEENERCDQLAAAEIAKRRSRYH